MTAEEIEARIESALAPLSAYADAATSAARDKTFAEWLMDTDTPAYARSYLATMGKSNCGLVVRKYLRLLGFTDREIATAYANRDTLAVSDIGVMGRRYGAWRTTRADMGVFPLRGDVIGWTLGAEHVAIVRGSRGADGALETIDGGQAKKGIPGGGHVVAVRYRTMHAPEGETPYFLELPQPDLLVVGGRKRVPYGRIDVRAMLARAA